MRMKDSAKRARHGSRRGVSAGASCLLVAGLVVCLGVVSGCGAKDEKERPVVVLIVDVSGSTNDLRKGSGSVFGRGVAETVTQSALAEGQLWATSAEAAVLANSNWIVNGSAADSDANFVKPEGGEVFQKEALVQKAKKLNGSSDVKGLLVTTGNAGSDLLGALQFAATVFKSYPERPRALVLLTDGGINARGTDLNRNPPVTPAEQDAVIRKWKSAQEFPAGGLTGGSGKPVSVWIGGLGSGMTGNGGRDARSVRDLWAKLISAEGGTLVQGDASLNLINFPEGVPEG